MPLTRGLECANEGFIKAFPIKCRCCHRARRQQRGALDFSPVAKAVPVPARSGAKLCEYLPRARGGEQGSNSEAELGAGERGSSEGKRASLLVLERKGCEWWCGGRMKGAFQ
jgi:hypothetical protein